MLSSNLIERNHACMRSIRRFIAWCFALCALFSAIFLAASGRLVLNVILHKDNLPPSLSFPVTVLVVSACLTGLFAMAWWVISSSKPRADLWGMAASCAICLFGIMLILEIIDLNSSIVIGLPLMAVGLGSLAVFAFTKSPAPASRPVPQQSLPGDGTSTVLNRLLGVAVALAGIPFFNLWNHWERLHVLVHRPFLYAVPQTAIVVLAAIIFHEAGHVIAALCLDMKLIRVQLGPVHCARQHNAHWKISFAWDGLKTILLGGVQVVPRSIANFRRRKILQIAAGPVASILSGLAGAGILLAAPQPLWQNYWQMLLDFCGISLLAGVFNLVPFAIGNGGYSDGAKLYQLIKGGAWADFQRLEAMLYAMWHSPIRPRDIDIEVVENVIPCMRYEGAEAHAHLIAYSYYLDCGLQDQAAASFRKAAQWCQQSSLKLPDAWLSILSYGSALLCRDAAAARMWWDRLEQRNTSGIGDEHLLSRAALDWQEGRLDDAFEDLRRGEAWTAQLRDSGNAQAEINAARRLRVAMEGSLKEAAEPGTIGVDH